MTGLNGGDVIGVGWSTLLSLPADVNPWFGNGEHCLRPGRANQVLLVVVPPAPAPCTVTRGTAVLVIGITSFCSTAEPPPSFAVWALSSAPVCLGEPQTSNDRNQCQRRWSGARRHVSTAL